MIKDYLLENQEAYPRQIHLHLQEAIRKMGYQYPSYESLRKFIWLLERLGLIQFVREERARAKKRARPFSRRYYRANPDRLTDAGWWNPYGKMYSTSIDDDVNHG